MPCLPCFLAFSCKSPTPSNITPGDSAFAVSCMLAMFCCSILCALWAHVLYLQHCVGKICLASASVGMMQLALGWVGLICLDGMIRSHVLFKPSFLSKLSIMSWQINHSMPLGISLFLFLFMALKMMFFPLLGQSTYFWLAHPSRYCNTSKQFLPKILKSSSENVNLITSLLMSLTRATTPCFLKLKG